MKRQAKRREEKQKTIKLFPIERILTCSPSDYCASHGRNLRDYELKGVTVEARNYEGWMGDNFRFNVPLNAEVVTDFRFSYGGVGWAYGFASTEVLGRGRHTDLRSMASGTALIRRKKK